MDEIVSIQQIMQKCADFSASEEGQMPSVWKKVVSSIKNYRDDENNEKHMPIGERLASNTHVVEIKNGILLVETDHSGWIQYLRMYQKYILKGIKMECPSLKINSLAFRVKGNNINLHDNYEDELKLSRKEFEKNLEEKEKQANEFLSKNKQKNSSENSEKSSLPPELLAKFDSIRQSMLTNDDNK